MECSREGRTCEVADGQRSGRERSDAHVVAKAEVGDGAAGTWVALDDGELGLIEKNAHGDDTHNECCCWLAGWLLGWIEERAGKWNGEIKLQIRVGYPMQRERDRASERAENPKPKALPGPTLHTPLPFNLGLFKSYN